MKVLTHWSYRRTTVLGVVIACLGFVTGAAAVSSTPLPNPCTLLTNVHPEKTLAPGKSVTHVKLTKQGSAYATCAETVGAQPIYLSLSHSFGGFGGLKVTSTTHPTGLGAGDELVVGAGMNGGPVDFIVFHRGTLFADLSANGAKPSKLTTLARQVYKILH